MKNNRNFFSWLVMFILIVISWAIFRSPSMEWLVNVIIHGAWGLTGRYLTAGLSIITMVCVYALPLIFYEMIMRCSGRIRKYLEIAYLAAALVATVIFIGSGFQDFVYFEF